MGIRQLFALSASGDKAHRPRIVRSMAPHTMKEVFNKIYGVGKWCVVVDEAYYRLFHKGSKTNNNLGRMTTATDPVVSAQHHELVKNELFAFARYLYDEIESHTSWNIPFDESVWDYT